MNYVSLTNYLTQAGFRPIYVDEKRGNDAVGTLTIVARRSDERWDKDFIHVDLDKYLDALNRKDRVYRLARWLPRSGIFRHIRSVLQSIH